MFGGLELKGSATPERKKEEEEAAAPASGFSFLSGAAPAPAAPASGFSFLQPQPAASEEAEPPKKEEEAPSSAFSFLSAGAAPAPAPEEPKVEAAPAPSGFDFLTGSSPKAAEPAPAPDSGFSFMGAPAPAAAASEPPADLLATSAYANQPAGSGVVFGSAAAAKPKKKRNRTAKIGVGSAPSLPPVAPTPVAPTPEAPAPKQETQQEALEAAQRAEAFMQEKLREVPPSIVSVPSEDDSVVLQAKAAAAEAEKMQQRTPSLLGGLFRSRNASSTTAVERVPSASSVHSNSSATNRIQREQEEANRAAAERQLQMLKETPKPPVAEPPSFSSAVSAPASSFVPPTIAVSHQPKPSTFVPPTKSTFTVSPVVPKPKTPTDHFHHLLDDFAKDVADAMDRVKRWRQHRSGLLEERFLTVAKLRLATQQKSQAEKQQMAAAETEDFELADQMTTLLEQHEREEAECSSILENISRALEELDAQKEEVVHGVTVCFRQVQSKLKEFKEKEESKETEDHSDALQRFSLTSKGLSAENERLQTDWKHLERDIELVEEERRDLESSISEQAGEYEKLRDKARKELTEVEEEIDELRKKLAAKQKLAATLRTEAAGHDESVLRVRVKFARQLNRVQKKEMTIQDNREEWETEKNAYETLKEKHDKEVKEHSEALLARDQLLDSLAREVEMADTFESIISKEIGLEVSPQEKEELDEDLAQLQAEVVKCEAAVSEGKANLKAATNALAALEQEKAQLEARIPQLEEIKNAAAAKRDFKGAGKASKEIKEASARLQQFEDDLISDAQEQKASAEQALSKLESDLGVKRTIANEKDRESGVAAMHRLADNIKRLVATKQSVCSDPAHHSIKKVGAYVLDGQIEALRFEGSTYGDKFGGWDELMAGIEHSPGEAKETEESEDVPADVTEEANIEQPAAEDFEEKEVPVTSQSTLSKDDMMKSFKELTAKLQEAESDLEAAVAEEDFERAAELDEVLQELLAGVQALDLTDEEMELALAGGDEPQSSPCADAMPGDDVPVSADDPAGGSDLDTSDAEAHETIQNGDTQDENGDTHDENGDSKANGDSEPVNGEDDVEPIESNDEEDA